MAATRPSPSSSATLPRGRRRRRRRAPAPRRAGRPRRPRGRPSRRRRRGGRTGPRRSTWACGSATRSWDRQVTRAVRRAAPRGPVPRASRRASATGSAARPGDRPRRRCITLPSPHNIAVRSSGRRSGRIAPALARGAISSAIAAARPLSSAAWSATLGLRVRRRLGEPAVVGVQLGAAPQQPLERLPRVAGLQRLARPRRERRELVAHERLEQRLLGGEVPVDGADADLGLPRHVVHLGVAALLARTPRGRPSSRARGCGARRRATGGRRGSRTRRRRCRTWRQA